MAENERTLIEILRTLKHTQLRFVAARINVNSDAEACRRVGINTATKERWENEADVDEAIRMSLIERVGVAMEILQRGAGEAAHVLIDDVTHAKRHGEIRQNAAKDVLNRVGVKAPEKIALTDPTGEHEYHGLSDDQLDREIAAAIARASAEAAGGASFSLDDARAAGATDTAG